MQEHMNFWIKVTQKYKADTSQTYYKAHSSNTSWDWLERIAPCVQALQHITNMMRGSLGIETGSRHAPPDLEDDI